MLTNAYNIEIDKPDNDGNTPLILAVQNDDPEIIERIVAEVPNPDIKNLKNETAYNFVKDDTPNKTKILELLEKAKKQYALYIAIMSGSFGVVKSSTVSFDIPSVERNPLVVAIKSKSALVVQEVLNKKGANVNQLLRGEKTLLWLNVSTADLGEFRALLNLKPELNISDMYDDYTPIFLALKYDKPHFMEFLISAKADVNYQANSLFPGVPEKMTPLMFAAQEGKTWYVEKLLNAGADPLIKNSEGKTALDLAQAKQKVSVDKGRYQTIITLLEDKIKTIPSSKPTTPTEPSTPTITPTTSSQLMSLLQNLTQQLIILEKKLTV